MLTPPKFANITPWLTRTNIQIIPSLHLWFPFTFSLLGFAKLLPALLMVSHHSVVLFICTCVLSMCPKSAPVCQKYSIFNVKFSFSGKTCNVVRIGCVGLAKISCMPAHNGAPQSTVTVWSRGKKIKVQNTITWKKSLVPRDWTLTPLTNINTKVLVKLVKHKSVNSQKKKCEIKLQQCWK